MRFMPWSWYKRSYRYSWRKNRSVVNFLVVIGYVGFVVVVTGPKLARAAHNRNWNDFHIDWDLYRISLMRLIIIIDIIRANEVRMKHFFSSISSWLLNMDIVCIWSISLNETKRQNIKNAVIRTLKINNVEMKWNKNCRAIPNIVVLYIKLYG